MAQIRRHAAAPRELNLMSGMICNTRPEWQCPMRGASLPLCRWPREGLEKQVFAIGGVFVCTAGV
eukprot:scaffold132943_cov69-Phaeocystis_antarctica.AAC.2